MKRVATIKARFAGPRDMANVLGLPARRARELQRDVEINFAGKHQATFVRIAHRKNGTKRLDFESATSAKRGARKPAKVSKRAKTAKTSR